MSGILLSFLGHLYAPKNPKRVRKNKPRFLSGIPASDNGFYVNPDGFRNRSEAHPPRADASFYCNHGKNKYFFDGAERADRAAA